MTKKEPNLRQKKAFKNMLENGGKLQPAMEKAGYTRAYSKNPDKIKKTKGWRALMREYLPNRLLVKVAQEGLLANRVISAKIIGKNANENTDDFIEVPDHPTRQRFLETALKMRGKLTEKIDATSGGEKIVSFTFIPPTDDKSKDNSST